jgi:Domain of unknown function (DUF1707)/2TM domain
MNTMVTALPARRAHHPANGDPHVRVGDREREKVVTRLGQAFTQGYLSIPEYETRLSQALETQTAGALNQVLNDLPVRRIDRGDPRRRAARAAAARRSVQIHLSAYLTASLLMVAIWLALTLAVGACYFWPVWPILGGGIGVLSHAVAVRSCARRQRDPADVRGRPAR